MGAELGLMDLQVALDPLTVPGPRASAAERRAFQSNLARVVDDHHDLSRLRYLQQWNKEDQAWADGLDWDFAQVDIYTVYLRGTGLLIDCLKLATVGDRRAIEERLLLPAESET